MLWVFGDAQGEQPGGVGGLAGPVHSALPVEFQ